MNTKSKARHLLRIGDDILVSTIAGRYFAGESLASLAETEFGYASPTELRSALYRWCLKKLPDKKWFMVEVPFKTMIEAALKSEENTKP